MKKLLAILCTVAVLLGTVFTGMAVSAETALTKLTPDNLNCVQGTVFGNSDNAIALKDGADFVDSSFVAMVHTNGSLIRFRFANSNGGGYGLMLSANKAYLNVDGSGSNYVATYENGEGDIDYQNTPTYKIQVDIDVLESNATNFKVYVENKLIIDHTVNNYAPTSLPLLYARNVGFSKVLEKPEFVMPEFTRITPAKFGNKTAGFNAGGNQNGFASGTTLKNFTFEAYAKMTGSGCSFRFCPSTTTSWNPAWGGYGFAISDKTVNFGRNSTTPWLATAYTSSQTFANKTFFVKVNMACADLDGDGAEDDLKVWLWLDGECAFDGVEVIDSVYDYLNSKAGCMVYSGIGFYDPDVYTMATFSDVADIDKVEKILPSEMGFRNGAHKQPASGPYTAGDMGLTYSGDIYNKVFDIDVNFKNGGYLRYPMSATESGLELAAGNGNLIIRDWFMNTGLVEKGGDTIATITPETAGTALVYNDINVKIHVEKLNADNEVAYEDIDNLEGELGEIVNDVKVTYYINNTQVYQNTFIGNSTYDVVTDEETGKKSFVITATEGGTALFDGKNKMLAITGTFNDATVDMPKLEKEYTPEKWGLEYQKFEKTAAAVAWSFPVNQTFNTDIIIHEDAAVGDVLHLNNLGAIYLGSNGTLSYRDFLGLGNGRKLTTYDVRGKQMNLKLTLQSAALDEDGLANDLAFGVWFDGKLAGNKYIYIKDKARTVQGYLTVYKGVEFIKPATKVDSKLTEVIPEDAGFKSGTYNLLEDATLNGAYYNHNKATNIKYAIDTVFTTNITINEIANESGSLWLYYGSLDDLCLKIYANNTADFCWGNNHGFVTGVALPEVGTEFKYQVTIEDAEADLNMDGVYNDVRIGAWINGELMGGKYYYFATGNSRLATYHDSTANNAFVYWYNNNKTLDATVTFRSDARTLSTDYEVITPADYHTGIQGTYHTGGADTTKYPFSSWPLNQTNKLMTNKMFVAYIKAKTAAGSNMLEFTKDYTDWGGLRICFNANGTANIWYTPTNKKVTLPDYVPEKLQEWKITFHTVGTNYYIGIWIDGVLQNNSYIIFTDFNIFNYNMQKIGHIISNKDSYLYIGNKDMQTLQKVDLNNDVYTVDPSKYVSATINGKTVTETTDVTDYGDNIVVLESSNITTEKVIAIYVENDLTLDGNVNILDFIAMQKNSASDDGFTTHAAAAAAGKAKGDKCDALDIVALKKALLFA